MSTRIYLDNHATTPVDPAALEAMLPYFTQKFGNAASRSHAYGWEAEEAVEIGREAVGAVLGASGKEIIWTSGATESINLAIKGVAEMYRQKGSHIITTVVEHKATLDTCKYLETQGFEVTYLPVDPTGMIRLADLEAAFRPETILVSVIHGHNEIGTIQPAAEIGQRCKERGVLFHLDAAQTFGKVPVDVEA
ncbi:MAG: cysteine desulfurase family protein, partial [Candidatus Sericytochromatia bacterium]